MGRKPKEKVEDSEKKPVEKAEKKFGVSPTGVMTFPKGMHPRTLRKEAEKEVEK